LYCVALRIDRSSTREPHMHRHNNTVHRHRNTVHRHCTGTAPALHRPWSASGPRCCAVQIATVVVAASGAAVDKLIAAADAGGFQPLVRVGLRGCARV
jgi:hypothetical protein